MAQPSRPSGTPLVFFFGTEESEEGTPAPGWGTRVQ
jgi:hypothetical protein